LLQFDFSISMINDSLKNILRDLSVKKHFINISWLKSNLMKFKTLVKNVKTTLFLPIYNIYHMSTYVFSLL
jgi:hypothetical protein